MSNKRAAVRRERAERAKWNVSKGPHAEAWRANNQGMIDGRELAFCVVADTLYKLHGWKKHRIQEFGKEISDESAKAVNNMAVNFVINYYTDKVIDMLDSAGVRRVLRGNLMDIYEQAREAYFVASIAVMAAVLNSEHGFASRISGKGRLDVIMEYATNEYIKILLDSQKHTVKYYMDKIKAELDIDL